MRDLFAELCEGFAWLAEHREEDLPEREESSPLWGIAGNCPERG